LKPEELGKLFSGKKTKKIKKKKDKSLLSSVKSVFPKKKSSIETKTKEVTALDLLEAKKAPIAIVKKTGTDREEEIKKWLATEPGFLEGLTSDVLGVPTKLYAYQIRYLLDRSYFIHIDKSRQCLPEGSIVYTPYGPVCIEELKSGDLVYSYNIEKGILEVDEVSEAWESGYRFCRRFLTRASNRLEAGKEHPFLLEDNTWMRVKDLEKGDELKYIQGNFGFENPDKSIVSLLAYFMTDGSTVTLPKFTNNDKRLIRDFIKSAKAFDPSLAFRTVKKENGYETYPHARHGTNKKNKIILLIEKWKLRYKRKENKFLPEEVFLWNKKSQRLLLNRIFCCDGWYSCPTGEVTGIGIGTSNRKFAYQIQQLLWNFGIDCKVRQTVVARKEPRVKCGEIRDFWKLEICYRGAISIFYKEIGISSKQHIPLRDYQHHTRLKNRVFKVSEKIGKKRCFDISVKKNENFIFEGFVVHNTGYSYIYAGRSLAKAHLQHHQTSIFISINQEEANEKIVYARGLFESMPLSVQKKVVVDNKQSIEFEDKSGKYSSRTRIISHAQREPRGKGGNVDVYLDEAAHYTWGDTIYVAAVPIITRGSGTLTIGSSPLGKKGIHYDIIAKEAYRRIYSYHQTFWWQCIDFVKRGKFKEANKISPHVSTEERVGKYGSEKLIGIFISMDIEQFQQEYELLHIDESVSFFPIDLINKCVYEVVLDEIFLADDEYSEKLTFPIVEKYPNIDFKLYNDLESLFRGVQSGKISPNLYAGYDVGRKSNNGEFSIIEEVKTDITTTPIQIVRHLQTFRNKKFKYQKAYLKKCLDDLPRLKMKIDSGGIGEDMSEELADYSWRVEPIHFSNEWKEETCADFRIRLEEQLIALPNKKEVKNQIHSIKRKVTESGRFIFDAEKNKEHHGDIFWSIAMASSLGERAVRSKITIPSTGEDRIFSAPRVIPIAMARSFTKPNLPRARMPIGVSGLKIPTEIKFLHSRGAG
jgi:phage FluMu gp28-like protein